MCRQTSCAHSPSHIWHWLNVAQAAVSGLKQITCLLSNMKAYASTHASSNGEARYFAHHLTTHNHTSAPLAAWYSAVPDATVVTNPTPSPPMEFPTFLYVLLLLVQLQHNPTCTALPPTGCPYSCPAELHKPASKHSTLTLHSRLLAHPLT